MKEKPKAGKDKSKADAGKLVFARKRPASEGPTAGVEAAVAKITPARLAAFEILKLVGEGKGHSDELLHSRQVDALSLEDRNLTTALVMGVLRWQIALDAQVGHEGSGSVGWPTLDCTSRGTASCATIISRLSYIVYIVMNEVDTVTPQALP